MGKDSRYWTLTSINGFGKCYSEELGENRDFFEKLFPDLIGQENLPEKKIQRQLMQCYLHDDSSQKLASECLRCYISNKIKDICQELSDKFGKNHDFRSTELFPLVLDSKGKNTNSESLITRILKSFDPSKSNLSTWTSRMFKSDRLVKQFLLERGIEQITDWVILNYMTLGRLERILSNLQRTETEIEQAVKLLDSYHQVYRNQMLQHRKTGAKSKYPEPTYEQLRQIANLFLPQKEISPAQVLEKLQRLASILRQERIRRKNCLPSPKTPNNIGDRGEEEEHSECLEAYRQQLNSCLTKSAKQVIMNRFEYLQAKKTEKAISKAVNYLKALHLLHCKGLSMANIASELQLKDQPQVSRLLELNNLRYDIGVQALSCLLKDVAELAKRYVTNPERLKELNSKLQAILQLEIEKILEQARQETSTGNRRAMNNQLAQSICEYLSTRKEVRS